jgi:hypothetical protein
MASQLKTWAEHTAEMPCLLTVSQTMDNANRVNAVLKSHINIPVCNQMRRNMQEHITRWEPE